MKMKKKPRYLRPRGSGKSTHDLIGWALLNLSYSEYRRGVIERGIAKPCGPLRFYRAKLRRWWIVKQIEWRISHE